MVKKVVILAGGKGTRLPISARDIPKSLVEVGGKAMLAHHLDHLIEAGFSDIRLSLGYKAEAIIDFIHQRGYHCEYVIEPRPLGTGGAVKFAARDLSEPFLVLHSDTHADFDFNKIARAWIPGTALMISYWKDDARDFGLLNIEGDRVVSFEEKPKSSTPIGGYIHAAGHILHPDHLADIDQDVFMIEHDVFPKLAAAGRLRTFIHRGYWEDVGTEERLARIRSEFTHSNQLEGDLA